MSVLDSASISQLSKEIEGLTEKEATLVLSTKKLDDEQKRAVLTQAGIIQASQKISIEKAKEALANAGVAKETQDEIAASLKSASADQKEAAASREVTIAKLNEAMAEKQVDQSVRDNVTSTLLQESANKELLSSYDGLGAGFGAMLKSFINPVTITTGVIGGLAAAYAKARSAHQEYMSNVQSLNNDYHSSLSDIDSYSTKIEDLHEKLKDSNISYEDAKGIRSELLGIQDELIEKYGSEAGAVDLVTEAVNGNINALEKLKDLQWQQVFDDFKQSGGFWNGVDNFFHGASDNVERMVETMTAAQGSQLRRSFTTYDRDLAFELAKQYDNFEFDYENNTFTVTGDTLKEVQENLQVLDKLVSNHGTTWQSLSNTIAETKDTISEYDIFDDYLLNEVVKKNSELNKVYNSFLSETEKYRTAQTEQDTEGMTESLERVKELRSEYQSLIDILKDSQGQDLSVGMKEALNETFDSLQPLFSNAFRSMDFKDAIRDQTVSVTKEVSEEVKKEVETTVQDVEESVKTAVSNMTMPMKTEWQNVGQSAAEGFKEPVKEAAEEIHEIVAVTAEQARREIENELRQIGSGGNVDLLHLPEIEQERLDLYGWDKKQSRALTYANEEGTVAVNIVPVWKSPSGDTVVWDEDDVQRYVKGLLDGSMDDIYNVQIGATYTGQDAVKEAEADAQRIRELEEAYTDDTKLNEYAQSLTRTKQAAQDAAEATGKSIADGIDQATETINSFSSFLENLPVAVSVPVEPEFNREAWEKQGWLNVPEGMQPSMTTTVSDVNGREYALNFTPFLKTEEGSSILTPEGLQSYIDNVVKNGAEDTDHLLLGSNTVLQQAQQAYETARAAAEAAESATEIRTTQVTEEVSQLEYMVELLREFDNEEQFLSLQSDNVFAAASPDRQNAFTELRDIATEAQIPLDQLVDLIREAKQEAGEGLDFSKWDTSDLMESFEKANSGSRDKAYDSYWMKSAFDALGEDDLNALHSASEASSEIWKKIAERIQEARNNTDDLHVAAEDYAQILQEVIDEWKVATGEMEEAAAVKFNTEQFSATIGEIKKLSSLYDNWKSQIESNPAKVAIDITEVEALRETFGAEALGLTDAFDSFESIVTNAQSSTAEIEAAINSILTSYAEAKISMEEFSAANAQMVQSQLELAGVEAQSAQQFVQAKSAQAAAEQMVQLITAEGIITDQEKITSLAQEAAQIGVTNEQLIAYIMSAAEASDMVLTGDYSFLNGLCDALQVAIGNIDAYKSAIMSIGGTVSGGGNSRYSGGQGISTSTARGKALEETMKKADQYYKTMERGEEITKAIEAAQKDLELQYKKTGNAAGKAAKSGGGGGGASKQNAKETEKQADAIAELSKEIDAIQSAWKELDEIVQDYNETGKISVDQAQAIADMDFRHTALLNMESDALAVNEQGFEFLIQAKVREMQLTIMRKAIDLISTFTDEAVAAQYLGNAFIEMGNKALSSASMIMQLQSAVAGISGSLGPMGLAAMNMAVAGATNQIQMLDHVDFSAHGAGVGGAGGSKSGANGAGAGAGAGSEGMEGGEEQSYEKEFDWIERLLERLNKLTEKWTDSAERFFTFWNKNWALNQAIVSGRNEMQAQRDVITYAQKKANAVELDKSYKKKVEEGKIEVETVTDQEIGDAIDEYIKWYVDATLLSDKYCKISLIARIP